MKANIFLSLFYGLTLDEIKNFEMHYNQAVSDGNQDRLEIYDKVKIEE